MTTSPLRAARLDDGRIDHRGLHAHAEGQVIFSETGDLEVSVGAQKLTAGAGQAIWLPSGIPHASAGGRARMISLFVPDAAAISLPSRPAVLDVPDLVPGLMAWAADGKSSDPRILDAALALLEGAAGRRADLQVSDDPVQRIANAVQADPSPQKGIADWAAEVGVSPRTLLRRIKAETGQTWRDWRRSAALAWAASELRETDLPVASLAAETGYATPSAFSAAFRAAYGVTPSDWRRRGETAMVSGRE